MIATLQLRKQRHTDVRNIAQEPIKQVMKQTFECMKSDSYGLNLSRLTNLSHIKAPGILIKQTTGLLGYLFFLMRLIS
jgi:hypothetical protein